MAFALRDASATTAAGGAGPVLALAGDGPVTVGSLPTSGLCLRGDGVAPLHCLLEPAPDGGWRLVDLGTEAGVLVNGRRVEVEVGLGAGDELTIGSCRLTVVDEPTPAAAPARKAKAVRRPLFVSRQSRVPQAQRPEADGRKHLEVVAYWGDTVLNVDHFGAATPGDGKITIGDPTKAHFLSGGRDALTPRVLAALDGESCLLRLGPDMRARLRQDGAISEVEGKRRPLVVLGPTDFAHVQHGAVHYFLHFAALPEVELPKRRRWDRLLIGLGVAATLLYAVLVTIALVMTPAPQTVVDVPPVDAGPWETVQLRPLPQHRPPTPPAHATAQTRPPVTPHVEHPLAPVPPQHVAVVPPQQTAPAVTPATQPNPQAVAATQPNPHAATPAAQPSAHPELPPTATPRVPSPHVAVSPTSQSVSPTPSRVTSEAPRSSRLSPATTPSPRPAEGAAGHGPSATAAGGPGRDSATPAPLKGTQNHDHPGVAGATADRPALPDLRRLGGGLGPVLPRAGGLHTELRDSAGGVGGKAGSAARDYGLGGPGGGTSLALPGSGNRLGGWSDGPGGGLGGPGLGRFGRGPGGGGDLAGRGPGGRLDGGAHTAATVTLPPGDPLTTPQGLTYQEISQVIRQHLNEIRHCYEQVLQRSPSAAGKMKVGFTIGLAGRVETVTVDDTTIDDPMLRACVVSKIQRWAFPHPRGTAPVQVTYPFLFTPL